MIGQWNSSLSVLPVARVMIAQWDSSLSVLPVARAMIAQWDSSLSVLPVARVQFPATAEYFKRFFPGWSHSASPSWASVAANGSISPQRHHTTCGQRGGRTMNREPWIYDSWKEKKSIAENFLFTSPLVSRMEVDNRWHGGSRIRFWVGWMGFDSTSARHCVLSRLIRIERLNSGHSPIEYELYGANHGSSWK